MNSVRYSLVFALMLSMPASAIQADAPAKKKADAAKKAQEAKKKADAKKAEEAKKKAALAKKPEEAKRKAALAKKAEEEKKKAALAKKAEEAKKKADIAKKAEEAKKKAALAKKAEEEKKKAALAKKADEAKKKADAAKKAEEEKKKAALAKKAQEAKKKAALAKKAQEAKKAKPVPAPFTGMVVTVSVAGPKGQFTVKHANGTIKAFSVTGATKIAGLGVNSLRGVVKGQIVNVLSAGKETVKIDVMKQAEPTKKLVGKDHFQGTVMKVVTDAYGDNGKVWVKNAKGATKVFSVGNATHIDAKVGKQTIIHSLEGVQKGQTVHILSAGLNAVKIHIIGK